MRAVGGLVYCSWVRDPNNSKDGGKLVNCVRACVGRFGASEGIVRGQLIWHFSPSSFSLSSFFKEGRKTFLSLLRTGPSFQLVKAKNKSLFLLARLHFFVNTFILSRGMSERNRHVVVIIMSSGKCVLYIPSSSSSSPSLFLLGVKLTSSFQYL